MRTANWKVHNKHAAYLTGAQSACRLSKESTQVSRQFGGLETCCRLSDGRIAGVTSTRDIHDMRYADLGAHNDRATNLRVPYRRHTKLEARYKRSVILRGPQHASLRYISRIPEKSVTSVPSMWRVTTSVPPTLEVHNKLPTNLWGHNKRSSNQERPCRVKYMTCLDTRASIERRKKS
ncbi:uncharacterized protein LOC143194752 [Rhynchophorus ferrugineus]|uniref:uncharacterized protein LOC143194752 n=1 Tax=Rhynchophorus ferrugineus TaxID=354439 RepID=UPI003FCC4FAC